VADSGTWHLHVRKGCTQCQTSNQRLLVMVMLIMRVMMTIRTGWCAPHSAAWFPRVPATALAQSHPSPEVARELPHFLWQGHRLIEIGQELSKDISSCHLFYSPRRFSCIVSLPHGVTIALAKTLKGKSAVRNFHLICWCMMLVLAHMNVLASSPLKGNTPRHATYSGEGPILNRRLKIPSRASSPRRRTTLFEKGTATR